MEWLLTYTNHPRFLSRKIFHRPQPARRTGHRPGFARMDTLVLPTCKPIGSSFFTAQSEGRFTPTGRGRRTQWSPIGDPRQDGRSGTRPLDVSAPDGFAYCYILGAKCPAVRTEARFGKQYQASIVRRSWISTFFTTWRRRCFSPLIEDRLKRIGISAYSGWGNRFLSFDIGPCDHACSQ